MFEVFKILFLVVFYFILVGISSEKQDVTYHVKQFGRDYQFKEYFLDGPSCISGYDLISDTHTQICGSYSRWIEVLSEGKVNWSLGLFK